MATTISADNGSISGSAGLKSSADSSGILVLQSGANATAVTIDASQNVAVSSLTASQPVFTDASKNLTNTGTVPVANGGTGVTTSTGSGSNVLSTSPTLVTPVLGTPTSVTLTNGTGLPLSTGVTGTLPIANGGTNSTATPTAGGVVYGDGSAHQITSAGTSGQVLQSNGSSAPTWATISSGGMTLINTTTFSSAVTSYTVNLTGGYDRYLIIFRRVNPSSQSANLGVAFQLATSGGTVTSGYTDTLIRNSSSTFSVVQNAATNAYATVTSPPSTGGYFSGFLYLSGVSKTTEVEWQSISTSGGNNFYMSASGTISLSALPTSIILRLTNGSTTIAVTDGYFALYGLS